MNYNIYFGFQGNFMTVSYKYTDFYKTEKEAQEEAKNEATRLFMQYAGTNNIPSFADIQKESASLKIPLKTLLDEHMWDMVRFYAIPTELDSIPSRDIKKR